MGSGPRYPASAVRPIADAVADKLREAYPDVTVCGSLRRGEDTVSDIDILLVGQKDDVLVLTKLQELGWLVNMSSDRDGKPRQRFTVVTGTGAKLDVDVWTVPEEKRGAALLYCTGPGMLNTVMRRWARFQNLRLTLHGVSDRDGNMLASRTEEECCEALGWPWAPPERRTFEHWVELAAPFLDKMSEADFT